MGRIFLRSKGVVKSNPSCNKPGQSFESEWNRKCRWYLRERLRTALRRSPSTTEPGCRSAESRRPRPDTLSRRRPSSMQRHGRAAFNFRRSAQSAARARATIPSSDSKKPTRRVCRGRAPQSSGLRERATQRAVEATRRRLLLGGLVVRWHARGECTPSRGREAINS